jgi:hypothetical protein
MLNPQDIGRISILSSAGKGELFVIVSSFIYLIPTAISPKSITLLLKIKLF